MSKILFKSESDIIGVDIMYSLNFGAPSDITYFPFHLDLKKDRDIYPRNEEFDTEDEAIEVALRYIDSL